ncbi:MAG: sensor histidine kinase [Geminicoccaceae bacterium]
MTDKVLSLEIMPSASLNELQILIRDETRLASLEQKVLQQRNELALANQELAEAKRQAEAALREKSAFLANISHDLKTPLQVIMGNAEILRGDLSEAERDGFLQDVLDNSDFLLALITDLLDASALEAEQLKLNEEPVDIQSLLERIVSMAQRMPGGDKRCFDLSVDDHHRWILADPMRLQRILLNVIGNAVKFTNERGRISVSAGLVDTGELVIEIEDDGCGIDANLMERVFEPFMRGNTGNGSGLGLHIARGLADLHEAELVLASKAGIGTKASLRLPSSRIVNAPR